MADTCLTSVNPTGCGHYDVTVQVGGVPVSVHLAESELLDPFTDEERALAARVLLRLVRQTGLTLAQLAGRVIRGDEATNVKVYDLIGAGSVITKTNIGVNYVDVLPGASGQRALLDFTGATEYRPVLSANLVASGPFGIRIVRDSDNAILYENDSIALTGERELDPGWQAKPAWATGLEVVRLQAKSATAQDDPIFRRCMVLVR